MLDREREAEALRAANEWEAHRTMWRKDKHKENIRTQVILWAGVALWAIVFYMLFQVCF
jgi:hypothetical protein